MSTILLLVLLGAWLAVFIPAILSARKEEPLTTSQRFKRDIEVIAPPRASGGRWIVTRSSGASDRAARLSHKRVQARRARFLKWLVEAVAVSAVAALLWGGWLWELHIAVDLSLGVYVVMLVDAKRRRAETQEKIRSLQTRRGRARPPALEPAEEAPTFFDQSHDRAAQDSGEVVRLDDPPAPMVTEHEDTFAARHA